MLKMLKYVVPVATVAATLLSTGVANAKTPTTGFNTTKKVIFRGKTRGSYFWDTGGSGNGDTGPPASGARMQEGCFASPSWPMNTKGYIEYHGKRHDFFICDRGPGGPSHNGVMLDIDGKTYAKLTGGHWSNPEVIGGNGQAGNIPVTYFITSWGPGSGQGSPRGM